MFSVSAPQLRVLRKEPAGKDVADSDVFAFNDAFSEKLFRIKINSIQLKETEEENKKTNEQASGNTFNSAYCTMVFRCHSTCS